MGLGLGVKRPSLLDDLKNSTIVDDAAYLQGSPATNDLQDVFE